MLIYNYNRAECDLNESHYHVRLQVFAKSFDWKKHQLAFAFLAMSICDVTRHFIAKKQAKHFFTVFKIK